MFLVVTAPLGALGVNRTSLPSGTGIEFERTASVIDRCTPSFSVFGNSIEAVVDGFRSSPFVANVSRLSEHQDRDVYRFKWSDTRPEIVERVNETDGSFLSAAAEGDAWKFELRFPGRAVASQFYTQYSDPDHPITVERTRQTVPSERIQNVLTEQQRVAIARAVEAGYFEVPRRTTLKQLAADLDISDSAVSQRLRRGMLNVLQNGIIQPLTTSRSDLEEHH